MNSDYVALPAVYASLRISWWSTSGLGVPQVGGGTAAPSPDYALGAFAAANALLDPAVMYSFRGALSGITGATADATFVSALRIVATGELWPLEDTDPINAGSKNSSADVVDEVLGSGAAVAASALAAGARRLALKQLPMRGGEPRRRGLGLDLLRPAAGAPAPGSPAVEVTFLTLCATAASANNRSAVLARTDATVLALATTDARASLAGALNASISAFNVSLDVASLKVVSLTFRRSRFAALLDFLRRNIVAVICSAAALMAALLLVLWWRVAKKRKLARRIKLSMRVAPLRSAAALALEREAAVLSPEQRDARARLAELEGRLRKSAYGDGSEFAGDAAGASSALSPTADSLLGALDFQAVTSATDDGTDVGSVPGAQYSTRASTHTGFEGVVAVANRSASVAWETGSAVSAAGGSGGEGGAPPAPPDGSAAGEITAARSFLLLPSARGGGAKLRRQRAGGAVAALLPELREGGVEATARGAVAASERSRANVARLKERAAGGGAGALAARRRLVAGASAMLAAVGSPDASPTRLANAAASSAASAAAVARTAVAAAERARESRAVDHAPGDVPPPPLIGAVSNRQRSPNQRRRRGGRGGGGSGLGVAASAAARGGSSSERNTSPERSSPERSPPRSRPGSGGTAATQPPAPPPRYAADGVPVAGIRAKLAMPADEGEHLL